MKKVKLLFLLAFMSIMTFSFSACSNDDDDQIGSTSDLIGRWQSVSFTWYVKENGKIVEEGDTELDSSEIIVFKKDGTWQHDEYDDGEWRAEASGTWIYKNGKIDVYVAIDDETRTVTVKELTSSKLVVEYHEKYTEGSTSYEEYELSEYRKVSEY